VAFFYLEQGLKGLTTLRCSIISDRYKE